MACPASVSLCFVAGDTITIDFQYTDKSGVGIPLIGGTVEMQLLNKITDTAVVKSMNGGLTDEATGTGVFSLTKAESQLLLPVVQDENASISFVSVIHIAFSDTTTKTIAGVNVTINQGGNR